MLRAVPSLSVVVLGAALLGCGARGSGPVTATAAARAEQEPIGSPALAPLTARERELRAELEVSVAALATTFGERNAAQELNLARAADWLVSTLEKDGLAVRRQGYAVGDAVAQNLEVTIAGGRLGRQLVVVGAHYDSHDGSPGADDNASGVAAVVALARALRQSKPCRGIRLVVFASHAESKASGLPSGSLVYAKELAEQRAELAAMLNLHGLGRFSTAPGSQRAPAGLEGRLPGTGDFVAVLGSPQSAKTLEVVSRAMREGASLPIVSEPVPDGAAGASAALGSADHDTFAELGFPAVLVTDTVGLRGAPLAAGGDVPAALDFERMARAVAALEHTVRVLATSPPGYECFGPAQGDEPGAGEGSPPS